MGGGYCVKDDIDKNCKILDFTRQTTSERVAFRPTEDRLGLVRAVKPCASGAPLCGWALDRPHSPSSGLPCRMQRLADKARCASLLPTLSDRSNPNFHRLKSPRTGVGASLSVLSSRPMCRPTLSLGFTPFAPDGPNGSALAARTCSITPPSFRLCSRLRRVGYSCRWVRPWRCRLLCKNL